MIKLENLERKMRVNGIIPNQTVVLINLEQNGPSSVSVAYRRADGGLGERVHYRADEAVSPRHRCSGCGPLTAAGDC